MGTIIQSKDEKGGKSKKESMGAKIVGRSRVYLVGLRASLFFFSWRIINIIAVFWIGVFGKFFSIQSGLESVEKIPI